MNARPWGKIFWFRTSLNLLSPVSQLYGVFKNRNWLLNSEMHPVSIAITYLVWESLELLWSTAGRVISCLVLGILLDSPLFLSKAHPNDKTSFKVYMSFYVNIKSIVAFAPPIPTPSVSAFNLVFLLWTKYNDHKKFGEDQTFFIRFHLHIIVHHWRNSEGEIKAVTWKTKVKQIPWRTIACWCTPHRLFCVHSSVL